VRPVREVADAAVREWGAGAQWRHEPDGSIPEAKALVLSSERARRELGWQCAWDFETAVAKSVAWYRAAGDGPEKLRAITAQQIEANAKAAAA